MYLFLVYRPTSFIGPTKSSPHFKNGYFKIDVISLAKLCVANLLVC
jgi:hypothetical protein